MDTKSGYDLLEPRKRAYRVAELAALSGRPASAIYAGIAKHRDWYRGMGPDGRPDPLPAGAIAAVMVRDHWLIPLGAAMRFVDPVRFDRETAERREEQKAAHRAQAEALDAPEVVAAAKAEIARLLPGVEVRDKPEVWDGSGILLGHRFEVGLYEGEKMLIATFGWTVGATLPHLVDLAAVERLRRDVAAAGWKVREEHEMPHGIFATDPAGVMWYLDLPVEPAQDLWHHDRGPAGVASVAWDYGARAAAIVPSELLTDEAGVAAYLAALVAPGLMSAEQVAAVDHLHAAYAAKATPAP